MTLDHSHKFAEPPRPKKFSVGPEDPTLNPHCDLPYTFWSVVVNHNTRFLNYAWFWTFSRMTLAVGEPTNGAWRNA